MKWGFPEWIASVVGIGKLPFAPGTWGSLFAILSWFYFGHLLHIFTFIGLILSISLIGKRVSDSVVKRQSQEDPSFVVSEEEQAAIIADGMVEALKSLDERSRDIVESRWLQGEKTSLKELAGKYGVSLERIRQVEAKAFKTMQPFLQSA